MIDRLFVNTANLTLTAGDLILPCVIGKEGAVSNCDKVEGDSATPCGQFQLGTLLVRPDRMPAPATALPWRWLAPSDGWSDGRGDPAYNRPVRHPHPYSAERLWRDDGLYDLIVTTSHNTPPIDNLGSAIFLHCTVPERGYTEGCVAIDRQGLFDVLGTVARLTTIEII